MIRTNRMAMTRTAAAMIPISTPIDNPSSSVTFGAVTEAVFRGKNIGCGSSHTHAHKRHTPFGFFNLLGVISA